MEHIEDVKKDIEFLSMKLSEDACKTANTNYEGTTTKTSELQSVVSNKPGKQLLFSLGP